MHIYWFLLTSLNILKPQIHTLDSTELTWYLDDVLLDVHEKQKGNKPNVVHCPCSLWIQ
ncbi:uncharacterized protein BYT42DRAFT_563457 [Radiomyces spectabilis]|uniref:uncharacterized protein n=1 Tax=Radiomyces spectabilis TaxID=64574 RepID=UPI0022208795|nr:uncharacterized protein BYT42DRAFT_563457 [Radiomyces spectabilis]KAI8384724.1 hypothetical protein BYT42DRAFT_563457 [Radiomyces spectabilis]